MISRWDDDWEAPGRGAPERACSAGLAPGRGVAETIITAAVYDDTSLNLGRKRLSVSIRSRGTGSGPYSAGKVAFFIDGLSQILLVRRTLG